jgi:hypothetical protein
MPAIQPDLLKRQTAQIVASFAEPEKFVRLLREHMDWYSDRTRRPGLNSPPPPILHTYRVPTQVLRELRRQLGPLAQADPSGSLHLADALWREENLECRQLAIDLLSWAPAQPARPVEERLQRWADPRDAAGLLDQLLMQGAVRYRREAPDRYLRLAKDWMSANDPDLQALGVRLLTGLADDPGFDNLPTLYLRARVMIQRAPSELQPDLADLIAALARRSPPETAHYLEKCLKGAQGGGTASLIRRSLRSFPLEEQLRLRAALVQQ